MKSFSTLISLCIIFFLLGVSLDNLVQGQAPQETATFQENQNNLFAETYKAVDAQVNLTSSPAKTVNKLKLFFVNSSIIVLLTFIDPI